MIIAVRGVANVLTCCRPVGNFKHLPKVTCHTTVKSQVAGKKGVGPQPGLQAVYAPGSF